MSLQLTRAPNKLFELDTVSGFARPCALQFRRFEFLQWVDSVEKVGFSAGLNSGRTTIGEPTCHIEWFLGSSLTFAALSLG